MNWEDNSTDTVRIPMEAVITCGGCGITYENWAVYMSHYCQPIQIEYDYQITPTYGMKGTTK